MPYKVNLTKRHHIKKHTYRQSNYSDYNNALKNRGRIDLWISDDVLDCWQDDERIHDGSGSSKKYPNSTIEACHYLMNGVQTAFATISRLYRKHS